MTNKLRILIAEDHETVREGLKLIADSYTHLTLTTILRAGPAAVDLARQQQPHVVLMEL